MITVTQILDINMILLLQIIVVVSSFSLAFVFYLLLCVPYLVVSGRVHPSDLDTALSLSLSFVFWALGSFFA